MRDDSLWDIDNKSLKCLKRKIFAFVKLLALDLRLTRRGLDRKTPSSLKKVAAELVIDVARVSVK